MPTGYTYKVQTGETETLPKFAMECARAFGACVTMRDEPSDTPIPDRFTPQTDHHDNEIQCANERLRELLAMSLAEIEAAAEASFRTEMESWNKREAERALQRDRYQAMIDRVTEWQPPDLCIGLKTFMLEQLRMSLKHDCSPWGEPPARREPAVWLASETDRANRDIRYHTKERVEEIARVTDRNLWLDALRVSLVLR